MLKIKSLFSLLLLLAFHSACSLSYPGTDTRSSGTNTAKDRSAIKVAGDYIPHNVDAQNIENFYVIDGRRYAVLKSSIGFTESGTASWYGDPFHGQTTSNGEVYDMHQMTAAHKHLPLPSYVEVTNTRNGRSVVLRVNDRGPFVGDRVIDLSYAAAHALDVVDSGTAPVNIRGIDDLNRQEELNRIASPDKPAFIQVASFTESNNAFAYHQQLVDGGIHKSRILQSYADDGRKVLRVQIGPLFSGQEYDHAIQQLQEFGIKNTILIRD